ncbi:60S ribosomal protein L24-like [Vulpes lagopus]|uniref:60S ribosomal protein L24-like n=1 Tax=Vulpes lagopus TaxID=494514 RepID=UPI001BC8DD72|nr:60S ribosomal protein L24-like [Vulpes lagopus]
MPGFFGTNLISVSQKTKLPGDHTPTLPQSNHRDFKFLQKLSDSQMYSSKDLKMALLLHKTVQSLHEDVGDKAKINLEDPTATSECWLGHHQHYCYPRKVLPLLLLPHLDDWTVLYRRKHKKGQSEEIQKKRTRRAVKFQRAITGASLADIMAKRNQKPEVRKAQREQAIRAAKEAKKAKQASKKTAMAAAKAPTKAAPKQKIVKPVKVSAPRVGGKR